MHLALSVSCLGQFLGGHIHEYKSFDPHAGPVCVIRCGVRGVLAADHSDPASADHARDFRSPDGRWFSRETLWASRSFDLSHSGGSRCAGLFDDACGDLCPGRAFGRIHPWFCTDGFRGGAGI